MITADSGEGTAATPQQCPQSHLRVLELRVQGKEEVQGLNPALVDGDVEDGWNQGRP